MGENRQKEHAGYYYSNSARDVLYFDGESAGLRKQTVEVFRYLSANSHRVVSRDELHQEIWSNGVVTDDSLSKCISEIRKVLGETGRASLKTLPKLSLIHI